MYHSLVIHYLLKDILVASKFWHLSRKATINICVQVFCQHKFSAPLGKYQGAQLLDHMVRVYLVL